MDRPILAVDVDGVISLFGFEDPPSSESSRFQMVDGVVHCISLTAGERLNRLAESFEMVWATGWEEKANEYLPNLLGVAELPVLNFGASARFGSAHWKLGPLDEYARGRAAAWIDDSLDDSCYEWARERSEPTLLVPTEPALGLEEAHTEALLAWAKSLEDEVGGG
jgi:hypothetical protein